MTPQEYPKKPPRPDRYALLPEPPPTRKPRWWKGMWFVVDRWTSNQAVVEKFWSMPAAEHRVKCLNGKTHEALCRQSAPNLSYQEKWALTS